MKTIENATKFSEIVLAAARDASANAIERHRRLGESIVIMRDGKIVEIPAEEIPPLLSLPQTNGSVSSS